MFQSSRLMTRILSYAGVGLVFVITKILSSRFFGAYGLYIFIGIALLVLVIILWGFFRRDKSEGVGINLH